MSRTTNTILLRYGITTFWSSSLLTQKVSNTLLQFNNLCGLVLKNYFLNVLKIQCIKNNLILYTFKFNSQKQSFLVKYLMFLKKDNYNKLRHVYGINKNQKDAKKKKTIMCFI